MTAIAQAGTFGELRRREGYTRFFATVCLARTAATMFGVAVPLLILQQTGSFTLAGVTAAAELLPAVFAGPVLGAWLDVSARRRRLIMLDLLCGAAALGMMVFLAARGAAWLLPVCALISGTTRPLSTTAFSSTLPEIVGDELLDSANVLESASYNAALIVGPMLAGVIAATLDPSRAVEVELLLTLFAVLLIAGDEIFELCPAQRLDSVPTAVAEGLRTMLGDRRLRAAATSEALITGSWGLMIVGFPVWAAMNLHAGAEAGGYLWASVAAGSLASSLAWKRFGRIDSPTLVAALSSAGVALAVLSWLLAGSLAVALALAALAGAAEGPGFVVALGIRQRGAPPENRALILAVFASVSLAAIGVGSSLGGPVGVLLGSSGPIVVMAGLNLAASAVWLSLHRSDRSDGPVG